MWCFFGLQYYLKRYLEDCVVTPREDRRKPKAMVAGPIWADKSLFNRLRAGSISAAITAVGLPVVIKAVPEGTVVPCPQRADDHREHRPRMLLAAELSGDAAGAGLVRQHGGHAVRAR